MKNFKHEKKYISNHHQLATREAIEEINQFLAISGTTNSDGNAVHEIADEEQQMQSMARQTVLLRKLMAKTYPWLVHSQQLDNAVDHPR